MAAASVGQPHSIAQGLLDLNSKERSNLFPWRGQFSPELIELFLKEYGRPGCLVFDPFAGVGTTLLESVKFNMRSRGTELNPSAFMMAQAVEWARYSVHEREKFFSEAASVLSEAMSTAENVSSFQQVDSNVQARELSSHIKNGNFSREARHVLTNTLIRGMAGDFNFHRAFRSHCSILRSLPHVETSHYVFHADARKTPLAEESVNLVITSPPYINVFNYHENNRQAMELLGWDILSVARAELGSNRKNRGNRFLTVIQYCLDMRDVFLEMRRILAKDGKAIFVVGRESRVRGVPFENGELVSSLAEISGFEILLRQERSFTNRFGQRIFEDIVHIKKGSNVSTTSAVEIAVSMLTMKRDRAHKPDVMTDLDAAISSAGAVPKSPLYPLSAS